jgi:Uma2 family endonuclease
MVERVTDEVVYYYDFHPTEEDLMGETLVHADLVHYLMDVLRWMYRGQRVAVYENFNFYQTSNYREYPLAPDIAIIKGVDLLELPSWRVGYTGPAPQVVFEFASEKTWMKDLNEKPHAYAMMGVHEYFAYDPNVPQLRKKGQRLYGWRLDGTHGVVQALPLRSEKRLWSAELESWLVPDGRWLRLYDRYEQLRLTEAEERARQVEEEKRRAEAATWQAEEERRRAETAARQVEEERRRAETAARQAEAATRQAEEERRRAETAARQAEALAERLRSLGIDPAG